MSSPSVDLDSYLSRIGYRGDRSPTLATLCALQECHAQAIPFENLNPLMGWPVLLDVSSVQQKFPPDYAIANYYLYTNPASHFRNSLRVALPAPGRRYALLNNQFSIHQVGGETQKRVLTSVGEVKALLTETFGLAASRLNGFSVDAVVHDAALSAGWSLALLPQSKVLSEEVQDFIKAVIVFRCKLAHQPRVTRHLARIYRKIFSVMVKVPWELSSEDLDRFLSLKHADGKVMDATVGLAKLMSENLLSLYCPLQPRLHTSLTMRLASCLAERKHGEKLPDKDALHELARIVFQETPRSHCDCIRFCAIRLLILTGLRLNEVLMLPSDCLRWESHVDIVTGRPAGEVGGVSKTLRLRYFAEKHEEGAPDVLVEEHQWVAQRFQKAVSEAVDMALKATAPLRAVLTKQHRTRHLYPRSDLRRFKTTAGNELGTADLLFLVIRGDRNTLPARIPGGRAIAPISVPAFYEAVGVIGAKGNATLFMRYGQAEATHSMKIKPHSLRHVMNTEFFRLGLPDTAITQQFGRRSVAQSYEYDNRTLAERLAFVRLPEAATRIIRTGKTEELVAKMVVSGVAATSHIGQSFKTIQAEHGDAAAFMYLAANSDGFHVTPYGFCTDSFSVNPCTRHLKCFDQCKHFAASGLDEHRTSLEQLRVKLVAMKAAAASKPATTLGRTNQMSHAARLITGVDAALAAQAKVTVFPQGQDHSATDRDLFR